MTEQAEPSESKESKTPAALTRWPRDLTDLWAGWPPFGALGGPFRDIKVEEFIDGDHLVIRAELPGVDQIVTSMYRSTMACSPSQPNARKALGRSSTRAIAASSATAVSSDRSGSRQGPQLRWDLRRTRMAFWRSGCPSPRRTQPPAASRFSAADGHRRRTVNSDLRR